MQYEAQRAINKAIAEYVGWIQLPKMNKHFHYEWGERVMNWLPPGQTAGFMSKESPPNYFENVGAVLNEIALHCEWWNVSFANGWYSVILTLQGKKSHAHAEEFTNAFIVAFWQAIKKEGPAA